MRSLRNTSPAHHDLIRSLCESQTSSMRRLTNGSLPDRERMPEPLSGTRSSFFLHKEVVFTRPPPRPPFWRLCKTDAQLFPSMFLLLAGSPAAQSARRSL